MSTAEFAKYMSAAYGHTAVVAVAARELACALAQWRLTSMPLKKQEAKVTAG